MKKSILFALLILGIASHSVQADLLDGDFSVSPGSGTPTPTSLGSGSYSYTAPSTTDVGGAGGWTFVNSQPSGGTVYLINTSAGYTQDWVPQAAPSNTNAYVVQLDTISNPGTWTTGNAVYQTVTVTAGTQYELTFSINTEHGGDKAQISAADVMVTNANSFISTGSAGTISTSDPTNMNALTYGNVTGYQYTVDTSAVLNGGNATTWATYTLGFTATSSTVQIAFADDPLSTNSNISLESVSLTAVPEPSQWAMMMLLGVTALMVGRKLRDRLTLRPALI